MRYQPSEHLQALIGEGQCRAIEKGFSEKLQFKHDSQMCIRDSIQVELMKLLTSDHPEVFRVVWETGITAVILPEFDACMETPQHNPHHCRGVGDHILYTLTGVEKEKALRWAALLHDIGKPAKVLVYWGKAY